ncbi:MAG TPA: hypothetical protein VFE53_05890 [Mucilaginibacter sp.]|jgi:hypothetical protein|nr:hypothetical protein [Mucilaginibacter sp.]
MKKSFFKNRFFGVLAAWFICLISSPGLGQVISVVTPVSHQTYLLPDPKKIPSAADVPAAITSAETAAKALLADGATEKTAATAEQNELIKAETEKNEYVTAVTTFSKQDVDPYKSDLNNYNALGTKYTTMLAKYNKGANANNAMPAKDRKPATVAALSKQKIQVDSIGTQLGTWKTKLDVTRAKLDIKNAALQKQQKKYEAEEQAATAKLKASKSKIYGILNQLTICASYAARCNGLLKPQTGPAAGNAGNGYFDTPEYKSAVTELTAALQRLAAF